MVQPQAAAGLRGPALRPNRPASAGRFARIVAARASLVVGLRQQPNQAEDLISRDRNQGDRSEHHRGREPEALKERWRAWISDIILSPPWIRRFSGRTFRRWSFPRQCVLNPFALTFVCSARCGGHAGSIARLRWRHLGRADLAELG